MLHDEKLNYQQRSSKKKFKQTCMLWIENEDKEQVSSSLDKKDRGRYYVLRGETEPLLKSAGFWHSIIIYLLFNFIKFLGFLYYYIFWYFNERVLQSIAVQSLQAELQLVLYRTSTRLPLENPTAIYLCSLLASYFISHLWY